MPEDDVAALVDGSAALTDAVHWYEGPELLEPGDDVDGWRVELLRGHADGHIVLVRDDVLLAGDTILEPITPAVGLYPRSRPDPLGDYLASLEWIERLGARVAYAGHGDPVRRPAERAREIAAHHAVRLDAAEAALGAEPRSGWQVSSQLFRSDLPPAQRRFALAEALAHLERLVLLGRAAHADGGYVRA
jgi:glyoxylase-like metal-dependent hydrolase (beta-lactamase superfamily II)